MRFIFALSLLFLSACAEMPAPAPKNMPHLVLKPVSFSDLPGWGNMSEPNYGAAANAFTQSCARIAKAPPDKSFGPLPQAGTYARWQSLCASFAQTGALLNDGAAKQFFEQNFQPYAVTDNGNPDGLFTGYYQASLHGSHTRSARYNIPLYARPADLVMVNLGEFRDELKGQRIAGRVVDGNLKPYEDRAQIVSGNWNGAAVLAWVDDAVDAFFVQIQGSGVVILDDGRAVMNIGYAGQNGHIYTAIGKELIARGALTKENVSMQSIAEWLRAHPDQADEIMNMNRSYVFFEESAAGAKGAEGVTLTQEASLAVDSTVIPYGTPVWLDAESPQVDLRQHYMPPRFQRLMVAQDTGGAITGAVRGDVFWGYGQRPEIMAGAMKSKGRYWVLLPKN